MKIALVVILCGVSALCTAQDPWKNIYSQHAWAQRDEWQKAEELIALLRIHDGSHVADIGCHEGYMTFKLASKVGKKGTVYAVDLDQGKLEKLKRRADEHELRQIRAIRGQQTDPQLPAGVLDAVLILDTYHEMGKPANMLQQIKTALKNGGRLVICEPIAEARKESPREEQEKKHELALRFAVDDLRKAGFKIVHQKEKFIDRTQEKGDWMWVVVGEKM